MDDILRGKRLNPMEEGALKITSSVEVDRRIMEKVVYVNAAHVLALKKAGMIDGESALELLSALNKELGGYELNYRHEDVHMSLEEDLKSKVGEKAGYIGLGKSRNDQVATSIRLQAREELLNALKSAVGLLNSMVQVSKNNINTVFIGMTHLQPAQPITASHWILSYAESMLRDIERLKLAYRTTNLSPMGAAALAGSTVPLDRNYVSDLLAFDGILENTMDAVTTRDFIMDTIYGLLMLASDFSRLCSDIIVYMSLGYTDLDDSFISTSSIMPQKRNAVVAEIIRAKSANLVSMLFNSIEISRTLNSSYNLDLQEITPKLWSAFDGIVPMTNELGSMVKGLKFNEKLIEEIAKSSLITASDVAEYISIKYKMPFRTAHHIVGEAIRASENNKLPLAKNIYETLASKVNGIVVLSEIEEALDPHKSIIKRATVGGPNPKQSVKAIEDISLEANNLNAWILSEEKKIEKAYQLLFNKEW